jgi:3'-5' exoribonuclease
LFIYNLAIHLLQKRISLSSVQEELAIMEQEKLSHIILSHHGRVEWGTAIMPKTKEAEFFHMADHRSATIAKGY